MTEAMGKMVEAPFLRIGRADPRYPPLFIVGAPRSGTTIVSLSLLNRYAFAYVPNVSKRYPYLCTVVALAARLVGRYEVTFESQRGHVDGWAAPSDGWDVFHRWFPRYEPTPRLDRKTGEEMVRTVAALERVYGAPFLNKNNHNSTRIRELDRWFPDALFLHVTRDASEAIASLIETRREEDVPVGEWWSAAPPHLLDQAFEDQVDQAAATVVGTQAHVREALSSLSSDRWTEVDYRAFCEEPQGVASWVEDSYERQGIHIEKRAVDHPASFEVSTRQMDADLEARIRDAMSLYEGSFKA